MITILLIISILICLYFYSKNFYLNNPEEDRKDFLLGTRLGFSLSLLPIYFIQTYFDEIFDLFHFKYKLQMFNSFVDQFINVFFHIGVLEEGTKLLIVLIGLICFKPIFFKISTTKEKASTLFLMLAGVSLGFSLIENIVYVYHYNDYIIIILRSLISTIVHVLCGVEMGYGFAKMILNDKFHKIKWGLWAILVPITIHSFYDTIIKGLSGLGVFLLILGVLFLYKWVKRRITKLRNILMESRL
jgi:RsiW-degrading membrane proteinase PrsW (M82 family)